MAISMSRPIFLFFVMTCCWASVVHSNGSGGAAAAASMPCIQKLMPCQPYLKGSSSPPGSCCVPLKQIVADDSQCLCAVFNNAAFLKTLNVTQSDALALAKSCGANADTSICKKAAAAPSGSPSTPAGSSTSSNSSSTSPAPTSAAAAISPLGGSLCLAAPILMISSIIVSAF